MGKKVTRSRTNNIAAIDYEFINQKALSYDETCTFDDNDIDALKLVGAFPTSTILIPFDARIQPDFVSSSWLCFPEYPLTLGRSYPFPRIIFEFFEITIISYI